MAKRKKQTTPNNDMKVAGIVIGLFAAAVILFFIFSKAKESNLESHQNLHLENHPVVVESGYKPVYDLGSKESSYNPAKTNTPESFKSFSGKGGKIAIIIDDWGQTTANCKYLKEIPEPLAVSILPGLRHTKDVANCAKAYHKLTMLHLPLQALHNYDFYPPNYIIKTTMDPVLVTKIVNEDMEQLPSIEGVNNHMGSKATGDKALMRLIFEITKKRGLFFVDSMTSPHSVCSGLADEMDLAFGKRDVFLDNIITREAITKQFMVLAQKARRKGYAVAIGHAFNRLTMEIIKEEIPWLEKQGFEIVSIKELLRNR